jgi:hypothetical protein
MASILDRYGIKEVADVTFYEIDSSTGNPTKPVLYLDTLKVSTVEQTAENTSARGGKGNPELIVWDYGKEINVTLEDALFSAKSMAIMFGDVDANGQAAAAYKATGDTILRTFRKEEIDTTVTGKAYVKIHNQYYDLLSTDFASVVSFYTESGASVADGTVSSSFAYAVATLKTKESTRIEINPDTFPGTYYITGDTYARSETSGKDEFFQFIIRKAKVTSEVTLTMEAEGDPSTFSMNLKVLRPKDGAMMELVKYDYAVTGANAKVTE